MHKWLILFVVITMPASLLFSQTNTYAQFWNEIGISRSIFKKSGLEFNFGQVWSGNSENKNMLADNSQVYFRGWFHYYHSPRWKFSGFLAYYSNKDVPELKQIKAPEIRSAVQTAYFFKKIPYTLNARVRLENRNIKNDNDKYETSFRLRMQMRCLYPLNAKIIRRGTVYAMGSDELMFKTGGSVSGSQFFDRNRLTIGGGYGITDDIQLEITYVNDYLPRSSVNELYNALQMNIYFINPFANIKKAFSHPHPVEPDTSGN